MDDEDSDSRDKIEDYVRNRLKDKNPWFLDQVKESFKHDNHFLKLSAVDELFIEETYLKLCTELFFQDMKLYIESRLKGKNQSQFIKILLNSANNVKTLTDIKPPLNSSIYYQRLNKIHHLINEEDEETLIRDFRKICVENVISYSDFVEKELAFLEAITDFLEISEIGVEKLQLAQFCSSNLLFPELLKAIINFKETLNADERWQVIEEDIFRLKLKNLKDTARDLLSLKEYFFLETMKEVLTPYSQPPVIKASFKDGRKVVEIIGKFQTLSKLVPQLKNYLTFDEFRFVGANIFYIDADLRNSDFHGKNVVVFAKNAVVRGKITWNLTGKHMNSLRKAKAGARSQDGRGINGSDGTAGESGGNVTFVSDRILNPHSLTIISNGGNGGFGQEGGNGLNGSDGRGIYQSTLDSEFPSPLRRGENKTVQNIKKNSSRIFEPSLGRSIYISARKSDGSDITCSFYLPTNSFHSYQGYFLYRGSPGKEGGRGGEGSFAGEGGYCGEINVDSPNVTVINDKPGEKGQNGQGGFNGKHGRNGWDVGFTDWDWWFKRDYYGLDYFSKYEINYYNNKKRKNQQIKRRFWCPYYEKYAEITYIPASNDNDFKSRNYHIQNRSLELQARAQRRKTITRTSVKSQYSQLFPNATASRLKELRDQLKTAREEALAAATKIEKGVKIKTKVKIQRQIQSPTKKKRKKNKKSLKQKPDFYNNNQLMDLVKALNENPTNEEEWEKVKSIEMNWSEMGQVMKIFDKNKSNLKQFEDVLREKNKIASINELVSKTQLTPDSGDDSKKTILDAETVSKFLRVSEDSDNKHTIQTLNEGLDTKRLETSNFQYDSSQNYRRSVGHFILGSDQAITKKWRQDYQNFADEQKKAAKVYLEVLLNALGGRKVKSMKNMKEIIRGDAFLEILYRRYYNEISIDYDWEDCCEDSSVLEAHKEYLRNTGSASASFRELLAGKLDVNLRLYEEDSDEFYLINDHNPRSQNLVHAVFKDDKFIMLRVDEDFFQLLLERQQLGEEFNSILLKVDDLKDRKQFEDFIKKPLKSDDQMIILPKVFDEDRYVDGILTHFPLEDQLILRGRLKMIGGKYTDYSEILRFLYKRFSSEGRHVSTRVILFLVNSIINSIIEERDEMNFYLWIIAGFPQKNWINKLLLIHFENKYKKKLDKTKFEEYLSNILNEDVLLMLYVKFSERFLPLDQVEEILFLLSKIEIEDFTEIQDLGFSEWPYALRGKYLTQRLRLIAPWKNQRKILGAASNFLLCLENSEGKILVENLLEKLTNNKIDLSSENSKNQFLEILLRFYKENPKLSEKTLNNLKGNNIDQWLTDIKLKYPENSDERNIIELVDLVEANGNTSANILNNLKRIKESILNLDKIAIDNKPVIQFEEADFKKWLSKKQFSLDQIEEMVAVINRGIKLKKKFYLRHSSLLTIFSLLYNPRDTLLQMSTGEGKSMVIVALAIIKVLLGEKADVITNSSVLAKRDARQNNDVFELFNVQVSHNCDEDLDYRKRAYSNHQVVYGDLSSFQRDYLLDRFYGQNILGDRTTNNILVDEVDSMLLDNGNNILYLSQDLVGLDKLESLYVYIWQIVNKPVSNLEEMKFLLDVSEIKKYILLDLYGFIEKKDIKSLGKHFTNQEVDVVWKELIKRNVIYSDGRLKDDKLLPQVLPPDFEQYENRLRFLLNQRLNRDRNVNIPNYLKDFVYRHLDTWINSAITALFLKEQVDYVVDVNRSNKTIERTMEIVILDRDTGTDKKNSQWDESLHQFLQLKHGCRLTLQSLKTVFISNISYFKVYKNLYGLTGTLGSQRERDLLKEIHDVDFVTIPTFKPKKFTEEDAVLCKDDKDWLQKVFDEATKKSAAMRSVLIVCDSVADVDRVYKKFDEGNVQNVYTYTRDYEEFDIIQGEKKLDSGVVIIATNLAGRGIDIKITKTLEEKGGLHVIVSNLPHNIRIEQQAFGRAARQGEKGSGQLIFKSAEGQGFTKMLEMKHERDLKELQKISEIKYQYDREIAVEEDCFKQFKNQFQIIKDRVKDEHKHVREILMQDCLDKWAFWLDNINKKIKNSKNIKINKEIQQSLYKFLQQLNDLKIKDLKSWVEDSPVFSVKLGNHFARNGDHQKARELYDMVITKEPSFSEAAHYYKAFTLFDENREKFKVELEEASKIIDAHINFLMRSSSVIKMLKTETPASVLQIEAFENQKKGEIDVFYVFKKSIDDVLSYSISKDSFTTPVVDESTSYQVYDSFLNSNILQRPRIVAEINSDAIKEICSEIGIVSSESLFQFIWKFIGKDVNEEDFQSDLENSVEMPSREDFWKLLLDKGVLSDEISYVIVNKERLDRAMPQLQLPKAENFVDNAKGKIFLKTEVLDEAYKKYTFKEDTFPAGEFKFLKRAGVLSFNKMATIDRSKLKSIDLPKFDSISLSDFKNEGVVEDDVKAILEELMRLKILKKSDSSGSIYKLNADFKSVANFKMASLGVYEDTIKILLFRNFAYRIALQQIEMQIQENHTPLRIELVSNLHLDVMYKLLEKSIIQPSKLTPKSNISESSVKKILQLDNKIIKDITRTLKDLRSCLENFDTPAIKLKPLIDHLDGQFVSNIHTFLLDGLDHVLEFEEKKYTLAMILQTLVIVLIAVIQIAVGAALQLLTAGALAYVGTALISEGISDMIFAASCFRSGYFSWKDYGEHKWQSVLISVASCVVGAFFARGAKFAKVLAGTTWKAAGREIAKTVAVVSIKGFANAAVYVGIDIFIERCLKTLCENIATSIFVNIEKSVDDSKEFAEKVKEAYLVLGESETKKLIGVLLKDYFSRERFVERWLPFANNGVNSVLFQIRQAKKSANKKLAISAQIGMIVADIAISSAEIIAVQRLTKTICVDLSKKISDTLEDKIKTHSDSGFEDFFKEVKSQVKRTLREKCGQIIQQHVLTPIFQSGATLLLNVIGNKINKSYNSFKDNKTFEEFNEKKKTQLKELEKIRNENDEERVDSIQSKITEEFHETVIELEDKVRAKKIKENFMKEFLQDNKKVDEGTLDNKINEIVQEKETRLRIRRNKFKEKSPEDIQAIIESLENRDLRDHLIKLFLTGEDSAFRVNKQSLSNSDRKKQTVIMKYFGDQKSQKSERYLELRRKLDEDTTEFQALKLTYERIKEVNRKGESLDYKSDASLIPEFVLGLKFIKDDIDRSGDYLKNKRFNTVASGLKDGVLYMACNYHTDVDSGKKDKKKNKIYDIKNVGWGEDPTWLSYKLKKYCEFQNIKKLVLLGPQDKPKTRAENRAPHAEMQLIAYAESRGFKFDQLDTSKPPCVKCLNVLDSEKIKFYERPGINLDPTNWEKVEDLKIAEVASFDFKRDYVRVPAFRIPQVKFKREAILTSWHYFDGDRDDDSFVSSSLDGRFLFGQEVRVEKTRAVKGGWTLEDVVLFDHGKFTKKRRNSI